MAYDDGDDDDDDDDDGFFFPLMWCRGYFSLSKTVGLEIKATLIRLFLQFIGNSSAHLDGKKVPYHTLKLQSSRKESPSSARATDYIPIT